MLRVGLTGGIACGKSHVRQRLAKEGVDTLDLDEVAHTITAKGGEGYDEVIEAFGPRIVDGEGRLDRKALGAIVFADPSARALLNAIVHPKVREAEARWAAGAAGPLLVSEGAVLVEAGVHVRFDRLVVVHCSAEEQLRRLQARDRLDLASARARLASQMPIEEKRRFAHFEVDASGTKLDMDRAVEALVRALEAEASATPPRYDLPPSRALGGLVHGPAAGPGGLDPLVVLAEIASAGGLEMGRIASRLIPPPAGPWYQAAPRRDSGPGPESLALPLVLWALTRGAPDPPFLAAAAASLARLTHREPTAIATAVFFALALQETAVGGGLPKDLASRVGAWRSLAGRWSLGSPAAWVEDVLEVALRQPSNPQAARAALGGGGPRADMVGALVGLAVGVPAEEAPPPLREALDRLSRIRNPEGPALPGAPPSS
jgi:dephospho-CoA kinase